MMRYSVIGFVAGIAACIGWRLAPHGTPATPIVPSAMASSAPAAPVYDVAPLVVTTAAPSSDPIVAGFASPRVAVVTAKPVAPAAPRARVVAKRPAAPPPVVPSPPPSSSVKEDEMVRARHDYAAASAELGATL